MQALFQQQRTWLVLLLAVVLLCGCRPATTPGPAPVALNTVDPLQTTTPCVDITVSKTAAKVGESIEITGTAAGAIKPTYFGLEIKDEDADDSSLMLNFLIPPPLKAADVSHIMKMLLADYTAGKAVIHLKAVEAGATLVNFFVSAENFCGVPLGQGISPRIKITVNP
jgi:hypothetical protein